MNISLRFLPWKLLQAVIFSILAFSLSSVSTNASAKQRTPEARPMNFILVRSGDCATSCVQWISAEGTITDSAPQKLRKLLKGLQGRKLPVVFQSIGGDVRAALEIGRMIRAAGLETAIGRTRLKDCPMLDPRCPEKIVGAGWSEGEVYSGGSYCFSACPLALAGGAVRAAAPTARIGLHQITNSRTGKPAKAGRRDLSEISTRADPTLKSALADYFNEMGVNSDAVFVMMGLALPEGLYNVGSEEALKSGILTKAFSYSDEPGYVITGTGP